MTDLIPGLRRFQTEAMPKHRELFQTLSTGQSPKILFITCSDSRIDPALITQTLPGELFVLRNAGNIVPPYGPANGAEAAAIEYAIAALGVETIIICGHSACGAVKGLLAPDSLTQLPAVASWVAHSKDVMAQLPSEETTDAQSRLNTAIELNVQQQLTHLKTHPTVAAGLDSGKLTLQGWVYDIGSGDVLAAAPGERFASPAEAIA